MSIKKEWLERMAKGARPIGRKPAVQITFNDIDMLCERDWIMIEVREFMDLLERANGNSDRDF